MPSMISASCRLSLIATTLAITLPFLGAHHYLPLPTFYQEWLAVMLALLAVIPLTLSKDQAPWQLPRTALLPLSFAALAWMQYAAGIDVLFETTVLFSLYMVWAALLMLTICRIESSMGRDALGDILAKALLGGALLLAGTGLVQRWMPWLGMPYIFPNGGTMNGNIAQANSFADYLWLGVAATLYLHARWRLSAAALWASLPILIGCSLLSGSRSVYFYAVALTLWAGIWAWTSDDAQRRRLRITAAMLLPVLFALQMLLENTGVPVSSAQRIVAQGSYDPVRLTLWRAAFDIFIDHPWLGAGFDSFSREYFLRIERFPINGIGIPEHSHNALTEVAAEFGVAGLCLLGIFIFGWLTRLRLRTPQPTEMLAFGLLLILGIHSMLEYPLWYAHFLAIGVICLALTDGGRISVELNRRRQLLLAFATGCGLISLINLRLDYTSLEEAALGVAHDGLALPPEVQHKRLTEAYLQSLWRPYAALQFAARMPLGREDLEGRIHLLREATHFSPIRQAVFKEAALLQLDGQTEAAAIQLKRAALSYPGNIPEALQMMEEVPSLHAELQPLIERLRQRSF